MNVGDIVKFTGENTYALYGSTPYGIVTDIRETEPGIIYVRWGKATFSTRTGIASVEVIEPNPFAVEDVVTLGDKIFLVVSVDGVFVTLDNAGGEVPFPDVTKISEDAASEWRTILKLGNALREYAKAENWCGDYEESVIEASQTTAFSDRAKRVESFEISINDLTIGADFRTDIKKRIRDALLREFSSPGESVGWPSIDIREYD